MSTLSKDQIIKINELKKTGLSYIQISLEVGCGKSTVFKYLEEENKFKKYKFQKETEKERSRRKSLAVINWKREKKRELVEYKGGKCDECGYNKCIEALEFHHTDPKKKDFNVSSHSYSSERMKNEADKCRLLCSNCHKEEHFKLKNN